MFPVQARYYRAMVFYNRFRWAAVFWALSFIPLTLGFYTKILPGPWPLVILCINYLFGFYLLGWGMPWLNNRYLRCRRVYRVMNWKGAGLLFSHIRAWKNWPNENILPTVLPVEVTKRYTVYGP